MVTYVIHFNDILTDHYNAFINIKWQEESGIYFHQKRKRTFKARHIALAPALMTEMADDISREATCCPKPAAD